MLEKALEDWLARGGARTFNIQPATFTGSLRGVQAVAQIEPDDILVTVPEELLVSTSAARSSTDFSPYLHEAASLSPLQVLAAFLLFELSKGSASFWSPYLDSLPHTYTSLFWFSPQEAEQLQAPHAIAAAEAARQEVRQSHAAVRPLLARLGIPDKYRGLSAMRWALATLNSRTMYLDGDPAGVLMPFGDLHNHSPPPAPALPDLGGAQRLGGPDQDGMQPSLCSEHKGHGDGTFDSETRVYKLHARTRYLPGEQVFLCYGSHSNLDLLEHYGFVLDDNPHDAALLPVGALPDGQLQGSVQPRECWLHPCGTPSWGLLRALRTWAATSCGHGARKHAALEGMRVSQESEAIAMSALRSLCSGVLDDLPTSCSNDEEILARDIISGALSEQEVLAVRWRRLYKQSLLNCIALAQAVMYDCQYAAEQGQCLS
ncbi:hypothetical protein CVIRNUC_007694 [Coccomyxa viridis]|uniref:SET domain-containing protein n=1 Tax=Coccomyxa viridis TaxID=1274662 RepID=A0AAV1IES1_9CHLO|nr:hypothetical protein CVIRNUC_007694 [Coccomyxa viridis]